MSENSRHETERTFAIDAARRLSLDFTAGRLVSWSSRAIWHLPASGSALAISRPDAKAAEDVNAEAAAARAAAEAGVATPRVLAGPIALPGSRYATAFEWVAGRRASQEDWKPVVQEAAKLPAAAIANVPVLDWPSRALEDVDALILGPELACMLAARSEVASVAVGRLVGAGELVLAHGDLQPANALIDPVGRAWLLDFEFARAAPREWDPSKLLVLKRRFGEPNKVTSLLRTWPEMDGARLAACAALQEVLIVLWLVRMAREGTPGAAEEARRRSATLMGRDGAWHHLA